MFNKDIKEPAYREAETIIGPSIKIKGNFHGEGSMIIDGVVEGSIKTTKNLLLGNTARVTATIEAGEAKIGGIVTGNLKVAGYLEITATAKIEGDIEAKEISVEKGAVINGRCSTAGAKKSTNQTEQ